MESELKKNIKEWEHSFTREHGRNPTKNDIAASSPKIRALYKSYKQAKLKKETFNYSSNVSFDPNSNPWDKPVEIVTEKIVKEKEKKISFNEKLLSNIKKAIETSKTPTKHNDPNLKCSDIYSTSKPLNSNKENFTEKDSLKKLFAKISVEEKQFPFSFDDEQLTPVSEQPLPKLPQKVIIANSSNLLLPKRNNPQLGSMLSKKFYDADFSEDNRLISPISSESLPSKCVNVSAKKDDPPCEVQLNNHQSQSNNLKRKLSSLDNTSSETSVTNESSCDKFSNVTNENGPKRMKRSAQISDDASSKNEISQIRDKNIQKTKPAPKKLSTKPSDDNYIKLNLKVKRFSRKGTHKQNFLKKQKFKEKLNRRKASTVCFKCNQEGHWANKCPLKYIEGNKQSSNYQEEFDEVLANVTIADYKIADLTVLESFVDKICPLDEVKENNKECLPLEISHSDLLKTLKEMGLKSFRSNQEEVIQRILLQKSTLLMMPTGGGKSLCYQLPALLFQKHHGYVALIISPLISLMQDQLANLPNGIKGVALNSTLTKEQRNTILSDAKNGHYAFIMVSPEALVDYEFLQPSNLPPISFACIDEAHCLADWSHHFRPSYMRVCKVLSSNFNVKCFLGLSATCTESTLLRICRHLAINDPEYGCFRSDPLPKNLLITASRDPDRDEALIHLLRQEPFVSCNSILVYCATRDQTIKIASLIRIALKDDPITKKKIKWVADAYHAGLTSTERSRIQNRFMTGSLRILTATVAFGMGLDKSNLYAVIHYSRPKSFENYVQEIGRAGRDGKAANCHVFLPPMNTDTCNEANELKRYIYSNHVDLPVLKRLIRNLFARCDCSSKSVECRGHIRALSSQQAVQTYDLREETLATLLCYLELHPSKYLRILPSGYCKCSIKCYKGTKQLAELSQKSLLVSAALAIQNERNPSWNPSIDNHLDIDLVEIADRFGWNLKSLRKELSSLEWTCNTDNRYQKTGILVELSCMSWLYWLPKGDISSSDLDRIVSYAESRITRLEEAGVYNMDKLCSILDKAALNSVTDVDISDDLLIKKSQEIQSFISEHFKNANLIEQDNSSNAGNKTDLQCYPNKDAVKNNIRHFINIYGDDHLLTGRAIASIMHGMSTPLYSANVWYSVRRFWRCQLDIDWPTLKKWADEELRQNVL